VFWVRYTLDETGAPVDKEVFFTAPDPSLPGGADGMEVDRNGNLFLTGPGGILVVDPAGNYLGTIGLPYQPSNLEFGPGYKDMYVTAGSHILRILFR
jgi:gluconolactonase